MPPAERLNDHFCSHLHISVTYVQYVIFVKKKMFLTKMLEKLLV